jgi:hypothetical protein
VIIVAGWLIVEVALIVFGVLIVVSGVNELLGVKNSKKILDFVFPIITILIGAMLVVAKWIVVDWFFIVVGVVFIVNGVMALLGERK